MAQKKKKIKFVLMTGGPELLCAELGLFRAPFNFYDYHVGIHKESELLKQKAVLLTDSNI